MNTNTPSSSTEPLPIFPLGNVLFPRGRMKLRIFEARYMDMIAVCMQENRPFGINLIAQGKEVGEAAEPHAVGVEAFVVDWDMQEQGVLGITVRGARRFRIASHEVNARNTVDAQVNWLDESPAPVAEIYAPMQSLLQLIAADKGQSVIAPPYDFGEANWVGYRFAEILPIPSLARLRLLELEDAGMRLSIIQKYLEQHGLLRAGSAQG